MSEVNLVALKAKIFQWAETPPNEILNEMAMTPGEQGALVGQLDKTLGDKNNRYIVLGWLFNEDHKPMSSKELSDGQWYSLYKWVDFWKNPEDEKWYPIESFTMECLAVFNAAVKEIYVSDLEAQRYFEDQLDPDDQMPVAVGKMGGEVVEITESDHDTSDTTKERRGAPMTLRTHTRFGKMLARDAKRPQRTESDIMKELGYD
jgi:hypothetical protein